jgi:hypothetical protein
MGKSKGKQMNIPNPQHTKGTSDFAGLGAAPMPRTKSEYFNDGTYLVQIMDVKKKRSTHPTSEGELMVIFEFTVLEVLASKQYITPGAKKEKRSNDKGDLTSHVIKMKWGDNARSAIKGFLCAAMGFSGSQLLELDTIPGAWEEIMDRAVFHDGDEQPHGEGEPYVPQPLRGHRVKVRAHTVAQTKKPTEDFTTLEYYSADADDGLA